MFYEGLYVDGLLRKKRKIENSQAREMEKEELELAECTFQPNVVPRKDFGRGIHKRNRTSQTGNNNDSVLISQGGENDSNS